jgi:protein-S-isoprenylcysteine O-methyltransferase Ste14
MERAFMQSAPIGRWQLYLARSRAWTSLLVLAPVAVMALLSAPHFAFDNFAECALELLAWLLFLAGAIIRWWATLFIGGRKGQELITQGPYSICRNPLYFGSLLLAFSVAAFLQSASLAAALCVVALAYLSITVPVEEQKLASLHGAAFEEYCRRVPRFFPNPTLYSAPRELAVRLDGMRSEMRRMLQWATIPIICYLIQHLRMLPDWPKYYTLP